MTGLRGNADGPESQSRKEVTAWVGMVIFLASWGMMFGALFFTYGAIRARAVAWPPEGLPSIPLFWPLINTAVIALSSLTLQMSIWGVRRGSIARLRWGLLVSLFLGLVFIGLQWKVWTALYAMGLVPSSGFYGSVFYGLTWIHAAHVIVGLLALLWLCCFAFKGLYTASQPLPVRLWAMYWHFVGAVWLVVLLTVYVM